MKLRGIIDKDNYLYILLIYLFIKNFNGDEINKIIEN